MTNPARSVAASVLVLGACTTDGIGELPATPQHAIPSEEMTGVPGHPTIVATGGALELWIPDVTAIGIAGAASDGYEVVPAGGRGWPNTVAPVYLVRAWEAGSGTFEVRTSKGVAAGHVTSADVADVTLVPTRYQLDGHAPFALAPDRAEVQAVLADASGRRLVDATLTITDATAAASPLAWDRARIAPTVGRHALVIAGDALAPAPFPLDVVAGFDRVETVRVGDRTCVHAYAGATEVVTTLAPEDGTPDPDATNCARAATRGAPSGLGAR